MEELLMTKRYDLNSFKPLLKWSLFESILGFKNLLNLYPPFLASGIRVESVSDDFLTIRVRMCLNFWNENYVGIHFGGSLYSMCDPWFMFILMRQLGESYMVYDQSAKIDFLSPSTSCVKAEFTILLDEIQNIRNILTSEKKTSRIYTCYVTDKDGKNVAKVEKTLYIRKLKK